MRRLRSREFFVFYKILNGSAGDSVAFCILLGEGAGWTIDGKSFCFGIKCGVADACNAGWNGDGRNIGAALEGEPTDFGNSIRDNYAFDLIGGKGTVADLADRVAVDDRGNHQRFFVSCVARNGGNAIGDGVEKFAGGLCVFRGGVCRIVRGILIGFVFELCQKILQARDLFLTLNFGEILILLKLKNLLFQGLNRDRIVIGTGGGILFGEDLLVGVAGGKEASESK